MVGAGGGGGAGVCAVICTWYASPLLRSTVPSYKRDWLATPGPLVSVVQTRPAGLALAAANTIQYCVFGFNRTGGVTGKSKKATSPDGGSAVSGNVPRS